MRLSHPARAPRRAAAAALGVAAAAALATVAPLTAAAAPAAGGQPIRIGYIGMTLEGTDTLVAQGGIAGWDFRDEVATANALVPRLKRQGVEAIVVMVHEGGIQTGGLSSCTNASGPILDIARNLDPEIDLVVSGHTHQPYVCSIPDPAGQPRLVTSAFSFGRLITETNLRIDPATRDVVRTSVSAINRVVTRDVPADPAQSAILAKWGPLADTRGKTPVGTITADVLRGRTNGAEDRSIESDLGNLIADAQLWATSNDAGEDAQIALMNPGGVRADLAFAQSGVEGDGVVTYEEAFNVQPFSNILVTMTLTGTQLDQVLEQQWQTGRSRYRLHLGVSEGLEYAFDESRPEGSRIDIAGITLDGAPISPTATYRVTTNTFLADGGDGFTALQQGTNRTGGGIDLDEFVGYLGAEQPLAPPGTDRVDETFCPVGSTASVTGCTSGLRVAAPASEPEPVLGGSGVGRRISATGGAPTTAGVPVQILSFNDFHGHLRPDSGSDGQVKLDNGTTVSANGAEYLATHLARLRQGQPFSYTVTAGDNIGGSTFLSGLFHDEPTIESLESMGLFATGVGNHEFDEGVPELLRIQQGGCHPVDGCYFPTAPYDGAAFPFLAANVVREGDPSQTVLPPFTVATLPPGQVKRVLGD